MTQERFRPLLSAPALLSLARVPLAACFALLVDLPAAAFAVLLMAGITDVLDGWMARRLGLVSATGAVLDPITDKLFVLTVVVTLAVTDKLSVFDVLWLSTRELGELPLVVWFMLSRRARAARADHPSANLPGKLATLLQFIAIGWALFHGPHLALWIALVAGAGVVAAFSYWRRALKNVRHRGARGGAPGRAGKD